MNAGNIEINIIVNTSQSQSAVKGLTGSNAVLEKSILKVSGAEQQANAATGARASALYSEIIASQKTTAQNEVLAQSYKDVGAALLKSRISASGITSILPAPPRATGTLTGAMMNGAPGSATFQQTYAGLQQVSLGMQQSANSGGILQRQNASLLTSFQSLSVGMMGLQSGFAIFQQGKAIVMDFVSEANKLQAATLGLQNISKFKGIDPQAVQSAVQGLDLVKRGLLTVGDASLAYKNLLQSNFTLEESTSLIKGFGDAAAFGRESSLEFGYAITSATEGLKNGNSILVDNTGITKNLSIILREMGFAENDVMRVSSDAAVRRALYNGILKETISFTGDAEKLTTTFAGKQSQLNAEFIVAKQKGGAYVQDVLSPMYDMLMKSANANMKLAEGMAEVDKNAPGAVKGIKSIIAEALTFNAMAWAIDNATESIERFMRTAQQGIDLRPMGPELPPGFMRTGKGGEMEGIDYAGASTLNSKKTSGSKGKTAKETTTEYSRLKDEIKNTGKEFDLLKTQLTANGVQWNSNTEIVAGYIKKLDELNAKLKSMETDYSGLVTARVNQGVGNLDGLTIGNGLRQPIDLQRGDGTTPMSRFMSTAKSKEEIEAMQQADQDRIEGFGSGLSSLTNTLGLGDTALGDFVNGLNTGLSALNSFFQILGSLTGGGGGGWLGSLLGIGLSFIPGAGAAASAAGVLSGGGGGGILGGSIRGGGGNFQGNIGSAIRSESSRIVERPYIASLVTEGDKMRVMLKEVDIKRNGLKGRKD